MQQRSAKAKGSRFERYIAKQITLAGLGKAGRESASGAGFRKGDVASNLDWILEVKNQKKLQWYKSIDQAKRQAEMGNISPEKWALITRDPRTPEANPRVYVTIDLWEWLELLKKDSEPPIKQPDRTLEWDLQHLKQTCQKVIKQI